MKKLLPALLVGVALSGCTMFQARPFDPVEYDYAIKTAVNATHAIHRCGDADKTEFNRFYQLVNLDSANLQEYVANKDDSFNALPAAKQVRGLVLEMSAHKQYSKMYCQHKLSDVQASARMFARGVGRTDRFSLCKGDVYTRYAAFESSYKRNEISKDEFKELVQDLLQLKTIDSSGCTLENRVKTEEALTFITNAASLLGAL